MLPSKTILLVEDDDVDALTVERAFRELDVKQRMIRKENGEEAMKYLADPSNSKPFLILLDLNMPRMNGLEMLQKLKEDPDMKRIPVIVLTTSKTSHDISETFNLGIAGYMVKPVDFKHFLEILETVEAYWSMSRVPVMN